MQMEYHLHELIMMHLIHWIMTDESSIFFEMIDSECAQVVVVRSLNEITSGNYFTC